VIAIGSWQDFTPLSAFPVGSAEYPDRSTTLITEVGLLGREGSNACRLTGPGIQDFSTLCLPDPALMQANAALFPLGLDFILTSESSVAALPRSTRIEVM
jgi:alpha-D-ribose 1-methylphosphonate 5-triphosphate synthase subunit PhnH